MTRRLLTRIMRLYEFEHNNSLRESGSALTKCLVYVSLKLTHLWHFFDKVYPQETQPLNGITGVALPQAAMSSSLRQGPPLQTMFPGPRLKCVTPVQTTEVSPPEVPRGPCTHVGDAPLLPHWVEEASSAPLITQPTFTGSNAALNSGPATSIMRNPRLKRLVIPSTPRRDSYNYSISPSSPKRPCLSLSTGDRIGQENRPPSSVGHRVGSPAGRRRRNDRSLPSSPVKAVGRLGDLRASIH